MSAPNLLVWREPKPAEKEQRGGFRPSLCSTPDGRRHRWGAGLAEKIERYSIPEPNSGCVLWLGAFRSDGGYGYVRDGKRVVTAHRASYELARGPVPDGLVIDHLCRNRACVNPAHLEAVPHTTNVVRGISLAAQNAHKTHCVRGHELSGSNLYLEPDGNRQCRACTQMRAERSKARRKAGGAA